MFDRLPFVYPIFVTVLAAGSRGLCAELSLIPHTFEARRSLFPPYPGDSPLLSPGLPLSAPDTCSRPAVRESGAACVRWYTQGGTIGYIPRVVYLSLLPGWYIPGIPSLLPGWYIPGVYYTSPVLYPGCTIPHPCYTQGVPKVLHTQGVPKVLHTQGVP